MDFDQERDDILLLFLVAPGVINLLNILTKSRW